MRAGAVSLVLALHLAAAPGAAGPLDEILSLEERFWPRDRRDGVGQLPLAFGVPFHEVDVNSTIRIHVDPTGWAESLLAGSDLAAGLSPEAGALLEQSRLLRKAADEMVAVLDDAAELTARIAAGEGDAGGADDVRRRLQSRHRTVSTVMMEYLTAMKTSPDPADAERYDRVYPQLEAALTGRAGVSGPLGVARVFRDEADRILRRVERMATAAGGGPGSLALVLSAVHVGGATRTELGLPGYNDLPVGVPVPIDKTRLVPTAEEVTGMQAARDEAQRWAEVLNRLQAGEIELEDALLALLEGTAADPAPLEDALRDVVGAYEMLADTDWHGIGDRLRERLVRARDEAADDAVAALLEPDGELGAAIAGYRDRARLLAGDLALLRRDVERWRATLGEGADVDEVEALAAALGLVDRAVELAGGGAELLAALGTSAEEWSRDARALQDAADRVAEALEPLAAELRTDLETLLRLELHERLAPLGLALDAVAVEAVALRDRLAGLLGPAGGLVLAGLAAADLEPPGTSFDVLLPVAEDVDLDLQTVWPRAEDDVVVLRAWLYRVEPSESGPGLFERGERVDDATQQLRLLRFGWYTAPSVGLAYASSVDEPAGRDEVTRGFVPQTSWMFRRRSWRTAADAGSRALYVPRWHDRLSIGAHVVPLDLDSDNQIEVGFGITIGLWNDWIQLGAGIDLGLDDEPYYFLGTRLFQLLERAGIHQGPADDRP